MTFTSDIFMVTTQYTATMRLVYCSEGPSAHNAEGEADKVNCYE